jgi:DDE family transposase
MMVCLLLYAYCVGGFSSRKSAQACERNLRAEARRASPVCQAQVEPVLGQLQAARGCRRFLLRGLANIRAEWCLVCLTQTLLKLWRDTWAPITV